MLYPYHRLLPPIGKRFNLILMYGSTVFILPELALKLLQIVAKRYLLPKAGIVLKKESQFLSELNNHSYEVAQENKKRNKNIGSKTEVEGTTQKIIQNRKRCPVHTKR